MLIHWIVDGIKGDLENGFSSPLASNRYRAIIPAAQLRRDGHRVEFIPMNDWTTSKARSSPPDVYVIGKLLPNNDPSRFERLALQVLDGITDAAARGVTTVADFSDDHFENPQVGAYWRALAAQAGICTAGSDVMAQAVQRHSRGPVVTVGDPLASPPVAPRVFQSPKGVSAWAQRLLGGSKTAHRLKLVWYGNNGNWPAMQQWSDALGDYSVSQSLLVWVVTRPNSTIENYIRRFNDKYGPAALMELVPWDEITQWSVVQDADIVLVPSDTSSRIKTVKSSNRVADALNAGRYVVASPIEAYEVFRPYASLTNEPVQALQEYLADSKKALAKVEAGQAVAREKFNSSYIASEWSRAFQIQPSQASTHSQTSPPPVPATLAQVNRTSKNLYMNNSTFAEMFLSHTGHRTSKWVQYLEVYERYFARYRNSPCRILEIGVQNGGSLHLYQKYFSLAEKIVGIDVDPNCKQVESGNIHVEIGSQADVNFLADVNAEYGPFDIVIDDGSHVFKHQITSFEFLFPLLPPNALYLVEDTHTSYLPDFGGDIRKDGTFIEYAKHVVDQVNAPFFSDALDETEWLARHLYGVSFYDSMVVFEKRPKTIPFTLAVGSRGHREVPVFQDLAYFRKKHHPN